MWAEVGNVFSKNINSIRNFYSTVYNLDLKLALQDLIYESLILHLRYGL